MFYCSGFVMSALQNFSPREKCTLVMQANVFVEQGTYVHNQFAQNTLL